MNLNTLIKYLIWMVFFAIVLIALYFMLGKLGLM